MKTLDKYIIVEFLKIFILTIFSLMAVYLVIDFFEKIDEFVIKDTHFLDSVLYFVYKLPLINFHVTPIAVLLTTVVIIGTFSKHNEMTVMKACGISLIRITLPILSTSFVISIFAFLNSEFIIPVTQSRANYILKVKIRGDKNYGVVSSRSKIWLNTPDKSIWNIDYLNAKENILKGVNIFKFDSNRILKQRISSDSAKWINGKWVFEGIKIRDFSKNGSIKTESFKSRELKINETIMDFEKVQKNPDELSIREMYRYIKKTIMEGFDATSYRVKMHKKISFPLISFVMALVGIPFSLKYERNFGITFGIGLSILIGFSFWLVMSIGVSLGSAGVLPVVLSAWLANLIYISTGIYMLLSVRQ